MNITLNFMVHVFWVGMLR